METVEDMMNIFIDDYVDPNESFRQMMETLRYLVLRKHDDVIEPYKPKNLEDDKTALHIMTKLFNKLNKTKSIESFDDLTILNDKKFIMKLNDLQMIPLVPPGTKSYYETIQTDLKPYMRKMIIEWMQDICQAEKFDILVFPLAVYIMDKYLYEQKVMRYKLQLVSCVCLLIACKIYLVVPISVHRLKLYTKNSICIDELVVSIL